MSTSGENRLAFNQDGRGRSWGKAKLDIMEYIDHGFKNKFLMIVNYNLLLSDQVETMQRFDLLHVSGSKNT